VHRSSDIVADLLHYYADSVSSWWRSYAESCLRMRTPLPVTNRHSGHRPCWQDSRSCILWNHNFRVCVCTGAPRLSPESDESNPCFFLKIHFNTIFTFTRRPLKSSRSYRCDHQNPVFVSLLPHACGLHALHISCFFYFITMIFSEEDKWWSFSLWSFFCQSPVTSSHLGANMRLSTLNVREQVPHPYKTTGKIGQLYWKEHLSSMPFFQTILHMTGFAGQFVHRDFTVGLI
jgi:hypothetical protein